MRERQSPVSPEELEAIMELNSSSSAVSQLSLNCASGLRQVLLHEFDLFIPGVRHGRQTNDYGKA